ncbi:MAG: hypothetical protein WAK71_13200 [Streptosporangiaceae bacterium]
MTDDELAELETELTEKLRQLERLQRRATEIALRLRAEHGRRRRAPTVRVPSDQDL